MTAFIAILALGPAPGTDLKRKQKQSEMNRGRVLLRGTRPRAPALSASSVDGPSPALLGSPSSRPWMREHKTTMAE